MSWLRQVSVRAAPAKCPEHRRGGGLAELESGKYPLSGGDLTHWNDQRQGPLVGWLFFDPCAI
jgi:hypothetical protein